jgi:transcription elongation factor GreA
MTIGQAANHYLGTLPAGKRELARGEINRFLGRVGDNKPLAALSKVQVERYQQYVAETVGPNAANHVEELKVFLTDLKTKKLTDVNLGAGLRVRRSASKGQAKREEAVVVELTQEGLDSLKHELEELENVVAPDVRKDLEAAYQDHDFRENAPYDEAKRRMGEVQGQINKLQAQIKAARVVARQASTQRVGLGSVVVLHDLQYDEQITYTIVGPGEVDTRKGRISIQSPVGSALKDRGIGDQVEVDIPSGTAHYRIEKIQKSE